MAPKVSPTLARSSLEARSVIWLGDTAGFLFREQVTGTKRNPSFAIVAAERR